MNSKCFKTAVFGIMSILLLAAFVMPNVVQAQQSMRQREGSILYKVDEQQKRIDQGVVSGSLTRDEAAVLRDNLNYIRNEFHRLDRDGYLSNSDTKRLNQMLHDNSQMIYNKKHNVIRRVY